MGKGGGAGGRGVGEGKGRGGGGGREEGEGELTIPLSCIRFPAFFTLEPGSSNMKTSMLLKAFSTPTIVFHANSVSLASAI